MNSTRRLRATNRFEQCVQHTICDDSFPEMSGDTMQFYFLESSPMCRNRASFAASIMLAVMVSTFASAATAGERLRTMWRGQWVDYVELGDLAVTEGDIIIGSKDAARQWAQAGEHSVELEAVSQSSQKALTVDSATRLWLRAASDVVEVPYTIEAGNAAVINAAVTEVNRALAGVLQWVPRTTQLDYVAFNLAIVNAGYCASTLGRAGGRQTIVGDPTCGAPTFIHEMGHAMGLYHVQEDADANAFVNIRFDNIDPDIRSQSVTNFNTRTLGGYDYSSIMHYSRTAFQVFPSAVTVETRPPGIDLRANATTYSSGDLDALFRLYDKAPTRTTVTSHPAGLRVVVDGVTVTTPASFDWPVGSVHRVWASTALQTIDGYKFAFARWGHDASATPTLQFTWQGSVGDGQLGSPASRPASTVLTANFSRLVDVSFAPASQTGGASRVVPRAAPWPSSTSLYPQFTTFDLFATPSAGYQPYAVYGAALAFNGGLGLRSSVSMLVGGTLPAQTIGHQFYRGPMIAVEAAGDGILDLVRLTVTAPGNAPFTSAVPYFFSEGAGVWKYAMPSPQYVGTATRHIFDGFSGFDNSVTGEVLMPTSGTRAVTIQAHRELAPYTEVAPSCAGTIALTNSSGWVRFGSALGATVTPGTAALFAGWTGTVSGTTAAVATTVGPLIPEFVATFNSVAEPLVLTGLSKKLIGDDAAATGTITLTGTGFSAGSQVFATVITGGAPMATTYVDSHTLRINAGRDKFPATGRLGLYVRNGLSDTCFMRSNRLTVDVLPLGKSVGLKLTEFYNAGLDYYFLTGRAADKAALDSFPASWARTGNEINMYSLPTVDTLPLERHFFANVARGGSRGSHFFTVLPSDQALMTSLNPTNQKLVAKPELESVEAYAIPKNAIGACPAGTTPVYRAFKGQPRYVDDGNHRFSVSLAQHQDMVNRLGWTDEGVVFCGAQ